MRRVTGVLMAAAMALSALAVSAPPALARANGEVVPVSKADKDFIDYVSYLIGLMDEAGAAYGVFNGMADGARDQTTLKGRARYWDAQMPAIHEVRAKLKSILGRLDALPPFKSVNGAYVDIAAMMVRDTRSYLLRIDAMLVAVEDMVDAVSHDDDRRTREALATLKGSIIVLIDGQITIVKARQALFTSQDSSWHILGIDRVLYGGMSVIARVALGEQDPDEAAADLRRLAAEARQYGRSGRPVVAAERRAGGLDSRISDLDDKALGMGETLAAMLIRTADRLESGAEPTRVGREALDEISVIEETLLSITDEQVRLMNSTHT